MDLGLASKVVLISGGTSGIGLEAAAEFLQEGAAVVLLGRSEARGREAVKNCSRRQSRNGFFSLRATCAARRTAAGL